MNTFPPQQANTLENLNVYEIPEVENPMATDLQSLPAVVQEWKRIHDEMEQYSQQVRERKKKIKTLETIIMHTMKKFNIGALDLKSSGGRILYKKQEKKANIPPKNLKNILTEHFQDERTAQEAVEFIETKREPVTKEKIAFEK